MKWGLIIIVGVISIIVVAGRAAIKEKTKRAVHDRTAKRIDMSYSHNPILSFE